MITYNKQLFRGAKQPTNYTKNVMMMSVKSRHVENAVTGPRIPLVAKSLSVCVSGCLAEVVLLVEEGELETSPLTDL